jgi:RNA polymerase sigma-70 factor (ECF subfamily)
VQRLTAAQSHLYAFICSLLGSTREAPDVLQETNVLLWQRAAEYDPTREFLPWAYTLARYQVMTHRKRVSRDRLVLDDELLGEVAAAVASRNYNLEDRLRALGDCIDKLPDRQRELIRRRYAQGRAVKALAAELGQPATAVSVLLYRIRAALGKCIEQALAARGTS